MKITTSKGTTVDGRVFVAGEFRGKARLIVDVNNMTMSQAAEALDGSAWIRIENEAKIGVSTTYEGYGQISMISRGENGNIRVTLEGGHNDG